MLESALTAVAVLVAVTQPVPQVVRMVRTGSVAGVSGPTTWLGLVINAGWLAYGLGRGLPPVAVISGAYVLGYAAIGSLLVHRGNSRGLAVAGAAATALTVLTFARGWTTLGAVLAVAVGVQFLPQVVEAWRADDLTGLAPGTYAVAGVDGLVWGSYGVLVVDGPLMLYGLIMVAVAVLVLVPRRRWTRRLSLAA